MSALSAKYRHRIQTALTVLACAGLAACGSVKGMTSNLGDSKINPVNWITPFKIEVVQGNFVSKEQVEALKPGMPRAQVRDVLGTPLMASVFHADRWDYVFTLKRQGVDPQALRFTVFFKGDAVERVESGELPTEAEFVSSLDTRRKFEKALPLEATDAQLKAFQERNQVGNPAPAPLAPATTNFPPLEPVR